jgi:hypothetical protein
MRKPKELVDRLEQSSEPPDGNEERFARYGLMGLPFASGDVLAMRRFPISSLGEGYTSVWHHEPQGRWAFYSDVPPRLACPRYFGSAISETALRKIGSSWTGPWDFTVSIEGEPHLELRLSLAQTPATRIMNAVGSVLPDALWRREAVLEPMGKAASLVLRAGRLGLTGRTPNGQGFVVNPLRVWAVRSSAARMDDLDLSDVGPLPVQTTLGNFWIPQRPIFAIGRAFFEPFDPTRHVSTTAGEGGERWKAAEARG